MLDIYVTYSYMHGEQHKNSWHELHFTGHFIPFARMRTKTSNWCRILLLLFISWCSVDLFLTSLPTHQISNKWFSTTTETPKEGKTLNIFKDKDVSSAEKTNQRKLVHWNTQRILGLGGNVTGESPVGRHARPSSINQQTRENKELRVPEIRRHRGRTAKRNEHAVKVADDSTSHIKSTNNNSAVLSFPFLQQGYVWDPDGPGEMGKGVLEQEEDVEKAGEIFQINQFNLLASDKIAVNRTLPDIRPPRCKAWIYPLELPKTSVIIVFHNEAWSTLLRTLTSVVNRSPPHLLEEIILVDDYSLQEGHEWLGKPLEDYVSSLPVTVRVVRTERRKGLVGARLLGVAASKGTVLTFLDSHCECTRGWLEPLLERIQKDKTRVVCPVIDSISDTTFEYTALNGMANIGGFSWFPDFVWRPAPRKERQRLHGDVNFPIKTPAMAGGLFAIHREFFDYLGGYDSGMRIWGAENLALSFKVWLCGGSLEVIPCSHVGHVFRSKTPYSFLDDPGYTLLRNNRRVLEVWAGDFKHFFYALTPAYSRVEFGDISEERKLKDKLQCKSFQWYLDTVYPDHPLPIKFNLLGAIKNEGANLCLDIFAGHQNGQLGSAVSLGRCHGVGLGQVFSYNAQYQLQHDRFCLTFTGDNAYLALHICEKDDNLNSPQRWKYNTKTQMFINVASGRCLDIKSSNEGSGQSYITTTLCNGSPSQTWTQHNITLEHAWFR